MQSRLRKEHDQAWTRWLAALAVLLALGGLSATGHHDLAAPGYLPATVYVVGSGLWWWLLPRLGARIPGPVRRHVALLADHGLNAWTCFRVGELYGLFFWGPVFATLGYGLRFGKIYGLRSIAIACVLQSVAMVSNPFWASHPYLIVGILACNSLLPGYALRLAAILRAREVAAEERARHFEISSRIDHLTGVLNRRGFVALLEEVMVREPTGCLMFIDVDDFKQVNDSWGHEAGDRILIEVAAVLQSAVRSTDAVGRLGGDEFAVLIDGADTVRCAAVARQIIEKIKRLEVEEHTPAHIGASVGVAQWPADAVDVDGLIRVADHAMYRAKRLGKHRVCTA